jgi:hypothetical protein
MIIRRIPAVLLALALTIPAACGDDDPAGSGPRPTLQFAPSSVALDTLREAIFELRNTGSVDSGPLVLGLEVPRNDFGELFPMETSVSPSTVANLPAGAVDTIRMTLTPPADMPTDNYQTTLNVATGNDILVAAVIDFVVP